MNPINDKSVIKKQTRWEIRAVRRKDLFFGEAEPLRMMELMRRSEIGQLRKKIDEYEAKELRTYDPTQLSLLNVREDLGKKQEGIYQGNSVMVQVHGKNNRIQSGTLNVARLLHELLPDWIEPLVDILKNKATGDVYVIEYMKPYEEKQLLSTMIIEMKMEAKVRIMLQLIQLQHILHSLYLYGVVVDLHDVFVNPTTYNIQININVKHINYMRTALGTAVEEDDRSMSTMMNEIMSGEIHVNDKVMPIFNKTDKFEAMYGWLTHCNPINRYINELGYLIQHNETINLYLRVLTDLFTECVKMSLIDQLEDLLTDADRIRSGFIYAGDKYETIAARANVERVGSSADLDYFKQCYQYGVNRKLSRDPKKRTLINLT